MMIAERYALLERIGSGGFATTYRGHDRVLDRPVAIKVLRADYAAAPDYGRRFEQEAQAAAAVSHPNVVQVYDVARSDGVPVIVLQYVAGRDLRRVLREEGPLAPEVAGGLVRQALAGLAAVHRAGIIHRDIKPENILLGNDGVVRLTDFGIARLADNLTMTQPGTVFGTAGYIAPEQALGREVSQATDLYAMGVVLFELMTGRLPFAGDNALAVMMAHVEQAPPAASSLCPDGAIGPALDAVIARALAKDPAARFPDAPAMAAALTAALPAGTAGQDQLATQPILARTAAATASLPPTRSVATTPRRSGLPPPPAANAGKRRGSGAWRIPLLILVVAALGLAIVAADYFRSSGDKRPTQVAGVVSTVTPTDVPPDPTATAPAIAPVPTEAMTAVVPPPAPTTVPPTPTPTPSPVPTMTPEPTATPSPTATVTPSPTATAPVATAPIAPGAGGDNSPRIVPVQTPHGVTQPTTSVSLTFQPGNGHGHGKAKGHDKGKGK